MISADIYIGTDMNSLLVSIFILTSAYRGASPVVSAVNPCGADKFNCLSGECISQSEVCDFVTSCADGSDEMNCGPCDFEHTQCAWTDISSGQFRWQRRNESMAPLENGPPHDFTYGTSRIGNYMMVVPRKGVDTAFDKAKLLSPVLGNLAATCTLQFARFEVTGSHGITHVYMIPPGVSLTDRDKWSLLWRSYYHGFKYNAWTDTDIMIGRRHPGYRVLIVALIPGDSDAIGTAIDAVHFTNCSLGIPTGRCLATQFTCKRGSCVDRGLLCDFSDDCGDNSDEEDSICSGYTNRCDFENDLCNWFEVGEAEDFNWELESGEYSQMGPWYDHTYGTLSGNFIYIVASPPWPDTARARLKSPVFQASTTGNCRLRFFYFIVSLLPFQLNVYTLPTETGPFNLVWKQKGGWVERWVRVDIPLTSSVPFRVMIEGEQPSRYVDNNLAVDDLSFTPECEVITAGTLPPVLTTPSAVCGAGKLPCDNGQCISSSLFCNFRADCSDNSDESRCPALEDFEAGSLQHWTNDFSHNAFNWTLGLHGNSTPYTGPRTDHTTGTSAGRFAFVKANITDLNSFPSYLISPLYNQAGRTCRFTFWYSVQGLIYNTTNVYMRSGGTDHWLMSLGGSWPSVHKDPWRFAEVALPVCASSFRIVFEAISFGLNTAAYKAGSVSIDDLKFVNCSYPPPPSTPCAPGEYRCGSGHCISSQLLCDFQADCCDGSDEAEATCQAYSRCNFDYGLCDWSQSETSNLYWYRTRGRLSDFGSPGQDHTSGSRLGHYLYMVSRGRKPGQWAGLVHNLLQPKGVCVLRLWYHKYGSNSSKLSVYTNTLEDGMLLVESLSVTQRKQWTRLSVTLNSSTAFQVVIEGVVGNEFRLWDSSSIAIDDVSFTPACGASEATNPTVTTKSTTKPTVPPKPLESCTADQFMCSSDKSCIDHSSVCDFLKDCQDGSDEIDCGTSCDFEANVTCGWRSVLPESARWRLVTGSSQVDPGLGPKLDNTTGTGTGHYLLVDSPTGASTLDTVIFESHLYKESGTTCTVSFAYSIGGDLRGTTLSFLVKTSQGQMKTLWSADDSNGSLQTWRTAQISVGAFQQFALLIKAKLPLESVAAVAIDDISLLNCAPADDVSSCPAQQMMCADHRSCVPRQRWCDRQPDCADGSDEALCSTHLGDCNFDSPHFQVVCGWTGGLPAWYVANARQHPGTGPPADHMGAQLGLFLLADSSRLKPGHTADIETPWFPGSHGLCFLRFYYYMYGSQRIGPLQVYTLDTRNNRTLIWSVGGNKGSRWNYATVQLPNTGNFSVVFQATGGDNMTSDIAIDDVSFTPECATGAVSPVPLGLTCTGNTSFTCNASRQCLPTSWVCDGLLDCLDGSDEPSNCVYTTVAPTTVTTHTLSTVTPSTETTHPSTVVTTTVPGATKQSTFTTSIATTTHVSRTQSTRTTPVPKQSTERKQSVNRTAMTTVASRTTKQGGAATSSSPVSVISHIKTTTTSSVTNQHGARCPSGQFKCSSSGVCVPALLLCDNVADCTDNSDETHCPRCQANQYYCSQTGRCSITNATRCDGVDDCGDSSDESLCTGSCPAHYCQQGASCVPGTKTPQCGCTDSYYGNRCQYKTARQQGSDKHSAGWKVGLGVAAGVLGLVLVAVTAFLLIRKRKSMISRHPNAGLNNPVFDDYGTDNHPS